MFLKVVRGSLFVVFLFSFGFIQISEGKEGSGSPKEKPSKATEEAVFAGGCFWCMEPPFDKIPGVLSTTSGFAGGKELHPAYKDVASGKTGHVEAVRIVFDPSKVTFRQLVDVFWRQIDPTDGGGQFVDRGAHYRSVLFFKNQNQKKDISASLEALKAKKVFQRPIVTDILPYSTFFPADPYHQDFYKKNSLKYKYYRYRSGRDQFLEKTWGSQKGSK